MHQFLVQVDVPGLTAGRFDLDVSTPRAGEADVTGKRKHFKCVLVLTVYAIAVLALPKFVFYFSSSILPIKIVDSILVWGMPILNHFNFKSLIELKSKK